MPAILGRALPSAPMTVSVTSIVVLVIGIGALLTAGGVAAFLFKRRRQGQLRGSRIPAISEPALLEAPWLEKHQTKLPSSANLPVSLSQLPISTSSSTLGSVAPARPQRGDEQPLRLPTPPTSRDSGMFWISRGSEAPLAALAPGMTPSRSSESVRSDLIASLGQLPSVPLPPARSQASTVTNTRNEEQHSEPHEECLTPILELGASSQWRLGSHLFDSNEHGMWLSSIVAASQGPGGPTTSDPVLTTSMRRSSSTRIPVSRSERLYAHAIENLAAMSTQQSDSSLGQTSESSQRSLSASRSQSSTNLTAATSVPSAESCGGDLASKQSSTAAEIIPSDLRPPSPIQVRSNASTARQAPAVIGETTRPRDDAAAQAESNPQSITTQAQDFTVGSPFTTAFHHAILPDSPLVVVPQQPARALHVPLASGELLSQIAESSTTPKMTPRGTFVSTFRARLQPSSSSGSEGELSYVKSSCSRRSRPSTAIKDENITDSAELGTARMQQEEWRVDTADVEDHFAVALKRSQPTTKRRSGVGIDEFGCEGRSSAIVPRQRLPTASTVSPIMQASKWSEPEESRHIAEVPLCIEPESSVCEREEASASSYTLLRAPANQRHHDASSIVDFLALGANLSPRIGEEGCVSPLERFSAQFSVASPLSEHLQRFPVPVNAPQWRQVTESLTPQATASNDTGPAHSIASPALSTYSDNVWVAENQRMSIESCFSGSAETDDVGHVAMGGRAADVRAKLFSTVQSQRQLQNRALVGTTPERQASKRKPAGLSIYVGNSGETVGNGIVSPLTPPFTPHTKRSSSRLTLRAGERCEPDVGAEAQDVLGMLSPTERHTDLPPTMSFKLRPLSLIANSNTLASAGAGDVFDVAFGAGASISSPPVVASPSLASMRKPRAGLRRGGLGYVANVDRDGDSPPSKRGSFLYLPAPPALEGTGSS